MDRRKMVLVLAAVLGLSTAFSAGPVGTQVYFPVDLNGISPIVPHTIEEAYELADAIARDDATHVRDELGDLLFQVVFQARIAEEQGLFDFDAVAAAISDKLERRHPHVFGTAAVSSAAEQTRAWEEHKAAERRAAGSAVGTLDGVALGLPALTRAAKLGSRSASTASRRTSLLRRLTSVGYALRSRSRWAADAACPI